MDLSIIIVNWNVRDLVTKCIESVFEHTNNLSFEVILVDNASNDGSIKQLRNTFIPQIQSGQLLIIENHTNNGFSKANNQGFKEAKGDYILFMNPDMEMVENTALKMKEFMDKHQDVAMSTCALLYGDNTPQPNIKHDPKFFDQLLIILKLHHLFKNARSLKRYLAKDFDYTTESQVDQIMGAFVFTRSDVMKAVGGWDEDYWVWWEDLDLCRKVRDRKQKIMYTPISQVIHFEGKSFEQQMSLSKQKRFTKGMRLYFKKHKSLVSYLLLTALTPVSLGLAAITQLLKIGPRPQSRI